MALLESRVMLLAAGLAMVVVSGCACEAPSPRAPRGVRPPPVAVIPKMGPEVPVIRVKLGDDAACFAVAVAGPWHLASASGDGASGESLDWTEVMVQDGKVLFGSPAPVAGPVELRSDRDAGVWIRQTVEGAARERGYRGILRLAPTSTGLLRAVNVVPMEEYVAAVVPVELLKPWHVEAYKAQAVAARTYALIQRNQKTRYDFDVYDSVSDQVYGGCGAETRRAWEAVQGTWGVVATYRGAGGNPVLLKTYYSSTCGGETASAAGVFGGEAPPPLAGGVECTWCRKSPKYTWPSLALTKQEIGDALRRSGMKDLARLGRVRSVEVAERASRGGRADQIRIVDAAGQAYLLRAGYWRMLMGPKRVRSTWFDIQDAGDRILLKNGRGDGHGVGLCQWGAEYLAEHGKTAEEILRYYYPGVELVKAYEPVK